MLWLKLICEKARWVLRFLHCVNWECGLLSHCWLSMWRPHPLGFQVCQDSTCLPSSGSKVLSRSLFSLQVIHSFVQPSNVQSKQIQTRALVSVKRSGQTSTHSLCHHVCHSSLPEEGKTRLLTPTEWSEWLLNSDDCLVFDDEDASNESWVQCTCCSEGYFSENTCQTGQLFWVALGMGKKYIKKGSN